MNKVFDTQIAHRLSRSNGEKLGPSDYNISLNKLLETYLQKSNTQKDSVSKLMSSNPLYWDKRPLTKTMIEYASQDVVYLPNIYYILRNKMSRSELIEVFEKSSNCHYYSLINKDHKGLSSCKVGDYLAAYVK